LSGDRPFEHTCGARDFVKKRKREACGSKAVSAEGKPLHGAAKNSFYGEVHEERLEPLGSVEPH